MCFCLCNLAIAIDTLSDIKYDRRIDVEMNDCGGQFSLMCESQVGNTGQTRPLRRVYYWLHKDDKVPVRYSSTESSTLKMKPYLTLECSRFLREVCSLSDQIPRNDPGKNKQGSELFLTS